MKLDAILVLGGESDVPTIEGKLNPAYRSRSKRAAKEWWNQYLNYEHTPQIIFTGSHSSCNSTDLPESISSMEYMMRQDNHLKVPAYMLHAETSSQDTMGNFFYAWPYLQNLQTPSVGVVSDDAHLDILALWVGMRVYGHGIELTPLGTGIATPPLVRMQMHFARQAVAMDLWRCKVKTGDYESWKRYFSESHPIHAQPEFSFYGAAIEMKKKLGIKG